MSRTRRQAPSKKRSPHRSNSAKVSALSMLKTGIGPKMVCDTFNIHRATLHRWKTASIESGNWLGADGDNGLARPAERKKDPGSGVKNRKMTERLQEKVLVQLTENLFLTP